MSRPRIYRRLKNPEAFTMTSLRLKERMRQQLAKAAERNSRSFNAEVVLRLTASLTKPATLR